MADFTSSFWNWYIIIPTVAGIIACFLLVRWLSGGELPSGEEAKSMRHVWDENLEGLNNPLPSWWLKMFYITLVFAGVYLALAAALDTRVITTDQALARAAPDRTRLVDQ